jgi:transposase-like protein
MNHAENPMSDSVTHHRSFEVLTAEPVRSRRKLRHWSDEDKARLVAEALAPGSNVSAIARSHGLDPSQVYAWRRKALASGAVSPLTGGQVNVLETLFQYLGRDPQIKEVSILAHSMGNWLPLESLRQMTIRNGGLPPKFKNIMLAAPDVDVDVFRSQIADMGKQHPQFTLFVSQDDRALAVSRRVWGSVARLGSIDPEKLHTRRNSLRTTSQSST